MDLKWDIDSIYPSADSEEFRKDIEKYKALLNELNIWANENMNIYSAEGLEKYIELKNRLMSFNKLEIYLNLALSVDTENEALGKALDALEGIISEEAVHEALFSQFLKGMTSYKETPVLKEHSYFIKEQKRKAEHTLFPAEENAIAKMKINGSKLWEKQWQSLTSNLVTDYQGLTLTDVRNLAYSPYKDVRKAAYNAELEAYKKIKTPVSYCLNGIKGEVLNVSEMRKYNSPLDMTLEDSRMDRDILHTMLFAIEESLPKLREYFAVKSEKLGNSGALPFYDIFAPLGEGREYTVEQAREIVIKGFYSFSEDMGKFAENAFEKNQLDIMPHKGKVGGAYCESIHSLKESRILMNFGGSFDDIVTMAHELGHAFHNTRLFNMSHLNSFYPMPIAETASTFSEGIIINFALKDKSFDKLSLLEADLQGSTQCIVDIYSRFLFEDAVFKNREKGFISADELCQYMESAQKKAYGSGLGSYHKYMWICKPHYYDGDFNYYNFPYAFGALLSKGLYAIYSENGKDFIPLYDRFLSLSSTMDIKDAALALGIDLCDKSFWLKCISVIINEIDEFKKL